MNLSSLFKLAVCTLAVIPAAAIAGDDKQDAERALPYFKLATKDEFKAADHTTSTLRVSQSNIGQKNPQHELRVALISASGGSRFAIALQYSDSNAELVGGMYLDCKIHLDGKDTVLDKYYKSVDVVSPANAEDKAKAGVYVFFGDDAVPIDHVVVEFFSTNPNNHTRFVGTVSYNRTR